MPAILNPYLSFKDNAREAMTFYHSVFGGELNVSTFDDLHAAQDASEASLVMHSQLTTPSGFTLMGSDTPSRMEFERGSNSFSVSLSGGPDAEDELRGYWDRLTEGATVSMPLEKAIWGDTFGMLTDRFGIAWLVNIAGEQAPGGTA
ncbi:VOC family protein [Sinomonas cellulolyticus]|uniref:VOC family protein n=1 Tax=Sinomonas cellulolyticus TaxID=2801916 RepID=A0ABS1K406_9MICC|nr:MULTISPECIES: VOC family protein [Sinomonas]MBL0706255.1 VOC family protein [Sinomonas cellulolyticus]GHG55840.1 VOC family protein [Sinomonas sp. KCTC 49339]